MMPTRVVSGQGISNGRALCWTLSVLTTPARKTNMSDSVSAGYWRQIQSQFQTIERQAAQIEVMRCYIANKRGEEVEIPEELK